MGFLDFIFDKEAAEAKKIAKMQKNVTNMYVQPTERQYTLQALRDIGTPPAIKAILSRFNESSQNTTVDLEEKEYVYDILVDMCRRDDEVVKMVVEHIHNAESKINWPIKILTDIFDYTQMAEFLCGILESENTEYRRDPEKKQEVILRAAEFKDQKLAKEVIRFLDDQNETVRFLTVETLLHLGFEEDFVEPMGRQLGEEESLRVAQKIAAAFSENHKWKIPEDAREAVAPSLPEGYSLHKDGYIHKKRT